MRGLGRIARIRSSSISFGTGEKIYVPSTFRRYEYLNGAPLKRGVRVLSEHPAMHEIPLGYYSFV